MKRAKTLLLISVVMSLASCVSTRGSINQTGQLCNVGFRVITMQVTEDGVTRDLNVAVWYPTAAKPEAFQYGGPTWGEVAYNSVPLSGKGTYPMLVFSHGYGGCGLASAFFTEKLAARGWIVACPDHHDSQNAASSLSGRNDDLDSRKFIEGAKDIVNTTPSERGKFIYRPDELEFTLQGMISSALFGKLIDTTRIAAGGHSFGGFTSMALCGTIPDHYDPRIKALLLFSTGAAAYLITPEELSGVKIPTMLMMGQKERNQKRGTRTMEELENTLFTNMPEPKYFLEIRGASHFSFNVRLSTAPGTGLLSGNRREFDVITRYSIAFLEKYVAGKDNQDDILDAREWMLTRYEVER